MNNNVWLALTSLNNWHIIKRNNVYAVKKYKSAEKLSINDILIIYVIPKRIGGFYKIIEKRDVKIIDFEGDDYNYQFKLAPTKTFSNPIVIDQKPNNYKIIENLSIFKYKKHWGSVLMGRDIILLKNKDYDYLFEVLKYE
jgi:predicted RNA-binding protein